MKKNNIILIGFMGVGKGTIARALVKESSMFAIDTDDLIESMENRKIKKIFASDGEPYFRNLEKKTALWLEGNVKNTIISTGGGFFKQENIQNIGTIVYLKSSFEGILKRIKKSPNAKNKLNKRPLLKNKKDALKLFNDRNSQYEKVANVVVDVENKDIDLIVKEILGIINENN
ncbi:shikimate kinase [Aliarcobacter cibarius]|jgi:shikimate kinase|uniref:Shikimate kinase n=1 Tax=Aliarcobacter cibarius TaxID=255507 RepID=A0A5J6RHA2_9BACT|nr:shikimate kinase [Aliarcobacter cibarius]QEZ89739.1 shikimate kinase [Aliarcobacter cibarius]QKJ27749.1 shikimate kinase [Aliarcobacter cibarius]TLT01099.1 shikimate kinase [Aliarcobacter cibarius]TLT01196.1 shikimate kinase [Aliarcobacter cibarius]TLT04991.1 shikimate kinase [Aliarcobacter cibarius]